MSEFAQKLFASSSRALGSAMTEHPKIKERKEKGKR
jgi:hypothetical protein